MFGTCCASSAVSVSGLPRPSSVHQVDADTFLLLSCYSPTAFTLSHATRQWLSLTSDLKPAEGGQSTFRRKPAGHVGDLVTGGY